MWEKSHLCDPFARLASAALTRAPQQADLRQKVANQLSCEPSTKLILGGKILSDSQTIASLGLDALPKDKKWVIAVPRKKRRPARAKKQSTYVAKRTDQKKRPQPRPSAPAQPQPPASSAQPTTPTQSKSKVAKTSREPRRPAAQRAPSTDTKHTKETAESGSGGIEELTRLLGLEMASSARGGGVGVLRPITKILESEAGIQYINDKRIQQWIIQGLTSRNAVLASGTAEILINMVSSHRTVAQTLVDAEGVVPAIISACVDADLDIAAPASRLIIGISRKKSAAASAFWSSSVAIEAARPGAWAQVRLRALETAAKLANTSPAGPAEFLNSAYFSGLVSTVRGGPGGGLEDPLVWHNSLEILAEIIRSKLGFAATRRAAVFRSLLLPAKSSESLVPRDALALIQTMALGARRSGSLAWAAALAPGFSGTTGDSPLLAAAVKTAERGLESFEPTIRAISANVACLLTLCVSDLLNQNERIGGDAKESAGSAAGSTSGQNASWTSLCSILLRVAETAGSASVGQDKIASLVGIANVIGNRADSSSKSTKATRAASAVDAKTPSPIAQLDRFRAQLLRTVGVKNLAAFTLSPFQELASASYVLLRNAASHTWGIEAIASQPGFIERLLDRGVGAGSAPRAHEWRFALIQMMAHTGKRHPMFERYVDGPTRARLLEFLKQGPYYKKRVAQVKLEDSVG